MGFEQNQLSMNDVLSIAHPDDVSHIKKELEKAAKSEDSTKHYVEHRIIRRKIRKYSRERELPPP